MHAGALSKQRADKCCCAVFVFRSASSFHHGNSQSMVREDHYRRWRRLASWLCFLAAAAASIGVAAPWLFESQEGALRRSTLRSFAEDFHGARRYPVYRACRLVHSMTEHRIDRRIDPTENWVQWTLGQFYPPLLRTRDPDRILEKGYGDCSERVVVLRTLAMRSGLPSRIVGLGGHVVLEIFANGKWFTADPDYGVVYVGTVEELARCDPDYLANPLLDAGYPKHQIDAYIQILQSNDDNIAMPIDSPISPRLYWLEEMSGFVLLAMPCILWLLNGFLWFHPMRNAID
jgi:hypothetical protein